MVNQNYCTVSYDTHIFMKNWKKFKFLSKFSAIEVGVYGPNRCVMEKKFSSFNEFFCLKGQIMVIFKANLTIFSKFYSSKKLNNFFKYRRKGVEKMQLKAIIGLYLTGKKQKIKNFNLNYFLEVIFAIFFTKKC